MRLLFNQKCFRKVAIQQLEKFVGEIPVEVLEMSEKLLLQHAITKEVRQKLLEAFFRRIFQEVINRKNSRILLYILTTLINNSEKIYQQTHT